MTGRLGSGCRFLLGVEDFGVVMANEVVDFVSGPWAGQMGSWLSRAGAWGFKRPPPVFDAGF